MNKQSQCGGRHDRSGPTVCMKCNERPAIVVIRVGDPFCRQCFLQYATHKFRSAFGRNKVVGFREKVLLAFSGGSCSAAMLDLVTEGNSERAHKKLGFDPGLVYVDEGVISGDSSEDRERFHDAVVSMLKKSQYPHHISSLEMAGAFCGLRQATEFAGVGHIWCVSGKIQDLQAAHIDRVPDSMSSTTDSMSSGQTPETISSTHSNVLDGIPDLNLEKLTLGHQAEKDFLKQLNSFKSLTAKEDFIRLSRHHLLLSIARKHGYTKIMLGDCASKLAVSILSNISQGRGAHVALDTGFLDSRLTDVMFIRPMREFTSKETAMYNTLKDLHPVVAPNLITKAPLNASINRLTETFVTGLQNDFPSTVSTIFRTGSKMQAAKSVDQKKMSSRKKQDEVGEVPEADGTDEQYLDENLCPFCLAPLDTDVKISSALIATKFSRSLRHADVPEGSESRVDGCCDTGTECCGKGDGSCQSNADFRLTTDQILDHLCYGCQLLVRDMNDPVNSLPFVVMKNIAWRFRRSKMKEEISDFLLG